MILDTGYTGILEFGEKLEEFLLNEEIEKIISVFTNGKWKTLEQIEQI